MAQLLVRDIEGGVVRELKIRAAQHGHSAEEEHRRILREALRPPGPVKSLKELLHRIVPVDRPIAEEWGRMNAPDPLPVVDGLLAATARIMGLTLVTRNTTDVEGTGVELLDPFSSRSS